MITETGFYAYLYLSSVAYEERFLPWRNFQQRIEFLFDLTNDKRLREHLVAPLGYSTEQSGRVSEPEVEEISRMIQAVQGGCILEGFNVKNQSEKNDDNVSTYLTTASGVLGDKWKFHKGDIDWWPSVPHGHFNSNNNIKLDAYLGFTYDVSNNNKQLKRETKVFICDLWNQERFRKFAIETIDHFISENPYFHWRVPHPSVLPKRK